MWLFADPVRLTQVLINLLNNAAKFTPTGGHIWLIGEHADESVDGPDKICIRVRDTGVGIAPEVLPHVFDMFMQGDRSLEKTQGGLGVGLTLVRDLVEAAWRHGAGSQRREGSGQRVHRDIAGGSGLRPSTRCRKARTTSRPWHIHCVSLIADDNDDGREMLALYLDQKGHSVRTAADGLQALAAVDEFKPDVALLDVGMPGSNGYTVAKKVRRKYGKQAPVLVALSGLGQEADKARAEQSGFDQHFTKPVDVRVLERFLQTDRSQGVETG